MKSHALPTSIARLAIIVLTVAPWAHSSVTTSHVVGYSVVGHSNDGRDLRAALNYLPIFADFDGDHRLDQAELHLANANRCIRIRLGDSRQSDLAAHSTLQTPGILITRDVNRDNVPDLIWLSHSPLKPVAIWLGDGQGNFAEATNRVDDVELTSLLSYNAAPGTVDGSSDEEPVYLAPDSVSSELPHTAYVEADAGKSFASAATNRRRDLGLFLSYLRERGPPLQTQSLPL